jgi:hypothetical protein
MALLKELAGEYPAIARNEMRTIPINPGHRLLDEERKPENDAA